VEKNRKKRGWAAVALLAIAVPVLYTVSSGPAALALKLAGLPTWDVPLFHRLYFPFAFLPHPFIDAFKWWVEWWAALAP
jgi:hypothetical protein